jgi:hypothetical protein
VQTGLRYTPKGGHVNVRAAKRDDVLAIDLEDERGGLRPGAPPNVSIATATQKVVTSHCSGDVILGALRRIFPRDIGPLTSTLRTD